MSDVKISGLPSGTAAGTDEIPVNQAGTTRKIIALAVSQLGQGDHNHTAAASDGGVLTNDEHDGYSQLTGIASPSTPATTKLRWYAKNNTRFERAYPYIKDEQASEWSDNPFDWRNYAVLIDEFWGIGGDIGWSLVSSGGGTGTIVAAPTISAAHPGVTEHATSATSGTITRLINTGLDGEDISYFGIILKPDLGTTSMGVRAGFLADASLTLETSNGIYFSFDSAASANWRSITKSGGGTTANSMGVAYATGTWYFLELYRNASGNIEFSINGAVVNTHSTNIPTGGLFPCMVIETTNASDKQIWWDAVQIVTKNPLAQRWT